MKFNPLLWFTKRELDIVPPHFIKANTTLNNESRAWVESKLQGRFCVKYSTSNLVFDDIRTIYFEDSKEAMLYELRWSGSK